MKEFTIVPAGHDVAHIVEPKALKVEAPQKKHDDAAGDGPYEPAAHGRHAAGDVPPMLGLYLPAGH